MKRLAVFVMALNIVLLYGGISLAALNDGLVAYYPFNGNANDESGNENHGIVYGATLAEDRFGNADSAYSFDGIDDYIKASADGLPTGERTVSLWFYANTVTSKPVLVGYGGNGLTGTSWYMRITPAVYGVHLHWPGSISLTYSHSQQPVGTWHHFAATTDPKGTKIFVDGEEVVSNEYFVNNTYVASKDLAIGVDVDGYGIAPYTDANVGYFNGMIDEVRIYNRALSKEEICQLHHTPVSEDCRNRIDDDCDGLVDWRDPDCPCCDLNDGLVAYYPFDGNANDVSENGNHGTEFGGVTYSAGVKGQAASFDGIDDYVKASADGLPTGERTVSLWFYANILSLPRPVLLGYGGGQSCGTSWFIYLSPDPEPYFQVSGHCDFYNVFGHYYQPPEGAWYHWAITTDRSGTKMFINGEEVASNDYFVNNTDVAGKDLAIGVDVSRYGTAPYTSGNIGYFNGMIDEVRIYDRALSQEEITHLMGLRIASWPRLSVRLGEFSSHQFEAKGGRLPYSWSIVDGTLPSGINFSTDGVVSGTPTETGEYTFAVMVTDNDGDFAVKEFSLEVLLVLPPPDIRIYKTGTPAIPGGEVSYFIVVENTGSTEAHNLAVEEHLISPDLKTNIFSFVSAIPEPDFVEDGFVLLWVIPSLGPHERQVLTYRVQLNASVPLGTAIVGSACVEGAPDLGAVRECMSAAGAPCELCVSACNLAYCDNLTDCMKNCRDVPWPLKKNCFLDCDVIFGKCAYCLKGCGDECHNACAATSSGCHACADNCSSHEQEVTGSVDPNEKLVIAKEFIRPDQTLVYPIHFENITDVEARDVFVTDVLDSNLDVSTLEILSPDGASLDVATRTVRWNFINRNLQPDESDNVLLSIRPLAGLPSGTEIRNSAEMQFEVFEPMTTNEVVNIIDDTKPIGMMDSLPAETLTLDFPISWSGTDAVGEIDYYTVLVSVDKGSFTPFVERTSETSTVFTGESGRTYGFICIAADTAGNIEVQDAVAEAVTHVVFAEVKMELPAGWSMISLPVRPEVATITTLFPEAVVVYKYQKETGYIRVQAGENLEVGMGYWILLDNSQSYAISGAAVTEYTTPVVDGWYMLAGCTLPAQKLVTSGRIDVIYGYTPGIGYERLPDSEPLKPGKGYWVLFSNTAEGAEFTASSSVSK